MASLKSRFGKSKRDERDGVIRTNNGSIVVDVLWFDEDRRTIGAMVTNPSNTYCAEFGFSDFGHYDLEELSRMTGIHVRDGEASYAARP